MITTEQIKALRDDTGVSIMQCKVALEEAGGDADKARIILRKKSGAIAEKKAERDLKSGVVNAYVHSGGNVGAIVELFCETDFVAKNKDFIALAYDIAMHVAATNPTYLSKNAIAPEEMERAKEVFEPELKGKPEELKDKILQGKLDSYFKEKVLLDQEFVKDPERTIMDLITSATQKFGERIEVGRFTRFSIGR